MEQIKSRRGFLLAATSFLVAPAIVRASSLMAVKAIPIQVWRPVIYSFQVKVVIDDDDTMEIEKAIARGKFPLEWSPVNP